MTPSKKFILALYSVLMLTAAAHADSLSISANPTRIRADGQSTSALTITATVSPSTNTATMTYPVYLAASGPGAVSPSVIYINVPAGSSATGSATLSSTHHQGMVNVTATSPGFSSGSVQVETYKGK